MFVLEDKDQCPSVFKDQFHLTTILAIVGDNYQYHNLGSKPPIIVSPPQLDE